MDANAEKIRVEMPNYALTYEFSEFAADLEDGIFEMSAEMQTAIRYLASKGIINGTSETTFDPDGSITRAEISALIVRVLGKLDSSAKANFSRLVLCGSGVQPEAWDYHLSTLPENLVSNHRADTRVRGFEIKLKRRHQL